MLCNENAPLSKVIGTVVGSEPPLLTALIEISFSSVGKAVTYTEMFRDRTPSGTLHFSEIKYAPLLYMVVDFFLFTYAIVAIPY